MKRWICALFILLGTPALAQSTGQTFYRQYQAALKEKFGSLATDAELLFLLENIIDRKHLEVDYNHYFQPRPAPLTKLVCNLRQTASFSGIKNSLVYPLLRFVLPRVTPKPALNQHGTVGERIAAQTFAYLGVPYGSPSFNRQTNRGTLDCSGLVNYVFSDVGIQYRRGGGSSAVVGIVNSPDMKTVSGNPQPGDLLVRKHKNNQWSHVGIYVGNQQLIEAPYTGTVVRTTPYKSGKWHKILRYKG
ncbi:C40 family peptidase [Tellurirhabdus bombi]|uniref:C40 family peptidase n=1 Tax=Tellurirhabdus bombi TaxID=2907205 RepID=UPI001F307C1F|nr:NlpC/P60 family protein [Tellurirhabdus bombi]